MKQFLFCFIALLCFLDVTDATVSAGNKNVVAFAGYGVKHPVNQAQGQDNFLSVDDVRMVIGRVLGLNIGMVDDRIVREREIPTGDIFQPATAFLTVLISGVDNSKILLNVQKDSLLHNLFSNNKVYTMGHGNSNTIEDHISTFMNDLVVVDQADKSSIVLEEDHLKNTAFMYKINSLDSLSGNELKEELILLDAFFKKSIENLNKTHDGRLALQVALLNDEIEKPRGRHLSESNATGDKTDGFYSFDGRDETYLITIWTLVIFFLMTLLIFCCFPWADELDPLLTAALSKEAVKED